ncbi:hypothetical protein TcWFU_002176 [Taenia crassiceps]|uniref:Uncharacterized protein n=1 Tax=Taenia crassiceps TaxID=6207 RepID=A0ABR4Q5E9_9CEST
MPREAPPIMRKLLIARRQLLFSLVWLQGYAFEASMPQSPVSLFLLDDGTGSILVTIRPDMELPSLGAYVLVVGELEQAPISSQDPPVGHSPSLTAYRLVARTIMCLSSADKYFSTYKDSTQKRAPSSAYAELSWPMEVMDMSQTFFTPA